MPEFLFGNAVIDIDAKDFDLLGRPREPKKVLYKIDPENGSVRFSLRGRGLAGLAGGGYKPEAVLSNNKNGLPEISVEDVFGRVIEGPMQLSGIEEDFVRASSGSREFKFELKGFVIKS